MLDVSHVDVYYGDLQALWNVSLTIGDGEIVTLIGSNGAGKSTILRTISGLLKLKTGSISYDGIRLDRTPAHDIVGLGICMVPQGRRPFPQMSVLENLEVGAFLRQARQAKAETLEWIYHILPVLEERVAQMAGTLSGGEQQMLAIGRALMSRPKLLLIDEMSVGLSPLVVQDISRVIRQINESRKLAIFLVEQNTRLALALARRGYVMENGRILDQGDAKALLNSKRVKDAYLGIGLVKKES